MITKNPELRAKIKQQYQDRIRRLFGDSKILLSRKEAAQVKGEALGTIAGHRYLLPNGGTPDHIVRNQDYWAVDTVVDWCMIDRRQLRGYLLNNGFTEYEIEEINNKTTRCKIL